MRRTAAPRCGFGGPVFCLRLASPGSSWAADTTAGFILRMTQSLATPARAPCSHTLRLQHRRTARASSLLAKLAVRIVCEKTTDRGFKPEHPSANALASPNNGWHLRQSPLSERFLSHPVNRRHGPPTSEFTRLRVAQYRKAGSSLRMKTRASAQRWMPLGVRHGKCVGTVLKG